MPEFPDINAVACREKLTPKHTGGDLLMDGGVTAACWYGEPKPYLRETVKGAILIPAVKDYFTTCSTNEPSNPAAAAVIVASPTPPATTVNRPMAPFSITRAPVATLLVDHLTVAETSCPETSVR